MIDIAAAGPEDLDQILALESTGFASTEQWSRQSWHAQLVGGSYLTLAARDADGRIVGVLTLRFGADTAEMDRIVVALDQRQQGIARSLVRSSLAAAYDRRATEVILEVGVDNEAAMALYRSFGFVELTSRRDYYGPGLDAWVMRLIMEPVGGGVR